MFGFTQSPAACCQKTSHSVYKSYFCGLSCRLKDDYGHSARFLVNRDSTFLTLLASALTADHSTTTLRTCCNPLATATPLTINSKAQQYSAAIAICGLAAKCEDDISDHRGFRKVAANSIYAGTRKWQDTAISTLNSLQFPTAKVINTLGKQKIVETPNNSMSEAAFPTARSYEIIFDHLHSVLEIPHTPDLAVIGFNLGQLLYLRDAVDDLEKDQKKNHYNPLRYRSIKECSKLASQSFIDFNSALQRIPTLRHEKTLSAIAQQTTSHHSDLISNPQPKNKKRKQENSNSCWDACCVCDCCPSNLSCGSGSSSACNCDSGCGDCCSGGDCCSCDCCSCG